MPQVPYVPYPTAQPSTQGTPTLRLNTPSEAFGANVGQAIEGFGKGLEADSDKIFNRAIALQELQNETAARNQDIQTSKQMGALSADFHTKLGVNAGPEALEKFNNDLNDIYQKNRAALPNDDARRRYDATAVSFLNRETFNGSLHSGRQVKEAYKGSLTAGIDEAADGVFKASLNGDGTVGLDTAIAGVREKARNYAAIEGMTPEAAKDFEEKQVSKIAAHLMAGTAQHQPGEAAKLQDRYGSLLRGDDILRVQNTISTRMDAIGSRIEVDKVLAPLMHLKGDEKPPAYKDLLDQVDAMAEKVRPGDAEYRLAAERHLKEQYNGIRYQQRQDDFENKQTVEGAIIGQYSQGQRPRTTEELRNIVGVGGAYDKLSNSQKRHYENVLADQVRRGDRVDSAASLAARQEYVGMTHAEGGVQKFLDSDIMGDKRLSIPDKKYLFQMKQQLWKEGQANPAVSHALQVLGPDLKAAGYDRKTDEASFNQFAGILHDWMSSHLDTQGRPPKDKDILEAGRRMLQQHAVDRTFLPEFIFGKGTSEPLFKEEPPQEIIDRWNERRKAIDPTSVPLTREQTIRDIAVEALRRAMQKPSSGNE